MIQLIHSGVLGGPSGGPSFESFIAGLTPAPLFAIPLDETAGTVMRDAKGNYPGTYESQFFTLGQASLLGNGQGTSVIFHPTGIPNVGRGNIPDTAALRLTTAGTLLAFVDQIGADTNCLVVKDGCDGTGFGLIYQDRTPLAYTRNGGTAVITSPQIGVGRHMVAFRWDATHSSIWVDTADTVTGGAMLAASTSVDVWIGCGMTGCGDSGNIYEQWAMMWNTFVPDETLAAIYAGSL